MIFTRHGGLFLALVALAQQSFAEVPADRCLTGSSAPLAALTSLSVQGAASSVQTAPVEPETAELLRQRERLLLENQLHDENLRKELAAAQAELQRIRTSAELVRAKADRELVQKRLEIDEARMAAEEINAQLTLEAAKRHAALDKEFAGIRAARDRAQLEADLATAEFTRRNNTQRASEVRLAELRARVAEREQELEVEAYADQRPVYLKDPLQPNGVLVLSDRRIPLNGPITMEMADEISARIDYFNNKNKEFPIFLVIDSSPGGSVMAGYRILRSMQSSTAPVYVLVKSFAASMAAALCTLSDRSFAYPNAIIMHHQITSGLIGNLTVQREGLKNLEEWWNRLATPIAEKMGISKDEFIKRMYENTSTGDWKEFADNAVRLKWVDAVVGRCQETALIRNPDAGRSGSGSMLASNRQMVSASLGDKHEAKLPGMVLPRLNPLDCYYLYNPDGYFRVE
ncbi:MAG TPA: ATP-dependent Clp protease proteolytic subunit [Chthoniobacteraceae bacterium]|jgi:ATP-dependent Clp protease protease subunit